jgi:phosphoribosylanthranilate isomerase
MADLRHFDFETLTSTWTAEVNSAYTSVAGGVLRFTQPEQFQSEIALAVKVCGLTRAEDVRLCQSLGLDCIGFIFAEGSPRRVDPAFAASFPGGSCRKVGVFAGQELRTVLAVARSAQLDLIQLHGGEDPDFCRAVGPERVIRTFWPESMSPAELRAEMERFAPAAAYFLFDAGKSGGGSGKALNTERLRDLEAPRPWFLAGGLNPDTLRPALATCSPWGVDLNSGLEDAPGVKNHEQIRKALDTLTLMRKLSCCRS